MKAEQLEGCLQKKGEDILKAWKRRWFKLGVDETHWEYYKSASEPKPQGYIDLKEVTGVRIVSLDVFELVTKERIYILKSKLIPANYSR